MDRVVVGVDGSDSADRAAGKAAALAASMRAELVVVCAFRSTEGVRVGGPGDTLDLSASDVALKIAELTIEDIAARFSTLTATPRSEFGKPADVLIDVAKQTNASIIVVGNKRVQGMTHVLGSIAADVARHAPCDVYIAHTN